MRSGIHVLAIVTLAFAPSVFGSKGMSLPAPDPANQAVSSYNDGLRYRDRAWNYEKELAATQDPARKTQLEEQIRKTYAAAVRCQRAAVHNDRTLFQAYGELGYALRKSGDYAAALEAYDTALSLRSDYAQAIEYRAEAYLGLDRVSDARDAYLRLFNGGDPKDAALLAEAMTKWVAQHRADPGSVSAQAIDELDTWLSQRKEISRQSTAAGSWR